MNKLTKELGHLIESIVMGYIHDIGVYSHSIMDRNYLETNLDLCGTNIIISVTQDTFFGIPVGAFYSTTVELDNKVKVELGHFQSKRLFKLLKIVQQRQEREIEASKATKEEKEVAETIKYLKEHLRIP